MKRDMWPLAARGQISEYLTKSIENDKVTGAYIFCGPDNLGKTTIARYFAKVLLCADTQKADNALEACGVCLSCRQLSSTDESESDEKSMSDTHGDFHIIKREKDKKNIGIEQIRDFIRTLSMSSFYGDYKIGIIKHADSLSLEAANALLKTLEEPGNKMVVILVAQDADTLPATISSRSQKINFRSLSAEKIYDYLVEEKKVSREKARDIARLSMGRPALALKFFEDKEFYDFYKQRAEALLDMYGKDINEKFRVIDDFWDSKFKGQESTRIAQRVIEIWQGVARDWLLFSLGHKARVQHIYLEDKIHQIGLEQDLSKIVRLIDTLSKSQTYLKANVSPRLVFEKIALNI